MRVADADALQKQSAKLFAVLQRACEHRCWSMDRYGGDSKLHPTCHHEIYADVSWGECVEGKCPLLNPHKEEKTWGIAYMCPECGFIHTVIEDFGQYVYCPNCGAEMTEGKE